MSASASDAALARYRVGLRRQRLVYVSALGAVVVALVVTVSVAWSRGEVANTTLHTVARPPATVPIAPPAVAARVAWRTADRAAVGTPLARGTVVVYGRHTVRGVDARTGAQTWSYSRSNRIVCAAVQVQNRTVAVYAVGGNCDELTALDTATGRRVWTRTLDEDGKPLFGPATYQVLGNTLMVVSRTVIYTLDVGLVYDAWTYTRFGCSIQHAVLGTAGALISQNCTDPRCAGLKFCGTGPQLLLRNGAYGTDDKSKNPSNFDHISWNLLGNTDVPVSADGLVSALDTTTRALDLFDTNTGKAGGTVTLSPAPSASGPITAVAADDVEFVSVRGVAAALTGPGRPTWSRAVAAPVTAVPTTDSTDLGVDTARLTAPTAAGAAVLDGETGQVSTQVTLTPAPATGSTIYPLGAGQLVTGAAGTVAYR